ncbi:endonuclease domain-containing protein [Catellatospora methionotrophica]|uniref:endonuclease domain-containing protein n=1 Tax=Catellatospora methionotrophica TaxID=121620 RepID=UPI0033FA24E9
MIELAMSPLPEDAPAVLTFRPPVSAAAAEVVACALDELETAALRLFPAWLPTAEHLEGPGGAGVPAVRALAAEVAATTRHFGPFLADLAEQALRALPDRRRVATTVTPTSAVGPDGWAGGDQAGPVPRRRPIAGRFAPEVRATGLARVLGESYRRPYVALLVEVPGVLAVPQQRALAAAGDWLAAHGGFAVWLTGGELPAAGPVTVHPVRLPEHVAALAATVTEGPGAGPGPAPATLIFPPVEGRPRADSEAETALEAALVEAAWAVGRSWNRRYPARPHYVIDLVWPDERCAVEIDGDEHRGPHKFAHDRRRDVLLQLDGFAVLRFTNDQVLHERGQVLAHLKQYLRSRRTDAHKENR